MNFLQFDSNTIREGERWTFRNFTAIAFSVAEAIRVAKLNGKIVSVTDAGNLITDISLTELSETPRDESVKIKCDGHTTIGIYPADHAQPEMTFIALEGSGGFVELTLVGDDASRFLGIKPGDSVSVRW